MLSILLSAGTFGQTKKDINPLDIEISLTAITNNFEKTNKALVKIVLTNNSLHPLPASGWNIYFNSKNAVAVNGFSSFFTIKQLKGNLFQLTAIPQFKGLASKETMSEDVIMDGQILNKNDQPEGFYFVWDDAPTVGINIKNIKTTPLPIQKVAGKLVSDFATEAYNSNEAIEKVADENLPKVFPTPTSYQSNGTTFLLNSNVQINSDPAFINEANLLTDDLSVMLGKKITITSKPSASNVISLIKKEGMPLEGYELTVTANEVIITASTNAGIFYGIQSLKSLLPPTVWQLNKEKNIPIIITGVSITDAPRFAYRGYLQDVARNFQTKKEILRLLDLMASYKLNQFHFHLTDDEGWRLEIEGLPELTSLGAERGHSLDEKHNMPAAYGSGALTDSLYGSGYYTKADFIEILKYATARHIKVIPEIETPGHARAAIKSMDARYERLMKAGDKEGALQFFLRDTLDQSYYSTAQSFHDNVMDVAIPSTYAFVEKVVTEVVKLYQEAGAPLTTIHLGGDEVPAGVWVHSPDCISLIKNDPSIKNTDGLWYYYLGRVNNILKAKGLSLSGWEEISFRRTMVDGKKVNIPNPEFVDQNFQLYVWNNLEGSEDLAYKLANNGYKVVITFVTNFYLDMAQHKTYDDPGYYWGGYTNLEKVHRFIPYDYLKNALASNGKPVAPSLYAAKQRLTDYGKENILGVQGSLWGETLKGPLQLEYMLLPRLTAIAEKGWAKESNWALESDTSKANALYNKAWSAYNYILGTRELPRLDNFNGGYNYRIPFVGAIIKEDKVYANIQFQNLTIRYTVNGDEPTIKSSIYTSPLTQKGVIKFKAFNSMGRSGSMTVIEN